ncbi:MAG: IS1595 family transposase [bacterium]
MPAPVCPYCAFRRAWKLRRNKLKCRRCRREWSGHAAPVEGIRSTEAEWRKCIRVFLRERTIKRIVEETGIPHSRVERMALHLRTVMTADQPAVLPGPIEMDETYIGGQRKNKRLHIRRLETKRGHGTDKLPIFGLFSRTSGQVYVAILPKKLDWRTIFSTIERLVPEGAYVYTDGFKTYRGLKKRGYRHEYVDHDGGELVRGDVHTNNIEGFWGLLKRRLGCIGGMRRTHLYLFVGEIAWKFNRRTKTLAEQEERLLTLVQGTGFGGRN